MKFSFFWWGRELKGTWLLIATSHTNVNRTRGTGIILQYIAVLRELLYADLEMWLVEVIRAQFAEETAALFSSHRNACL